MPKSSIQRQEFAQKKPYFIAAVFSLALAVFLLDRAEARLADGWKTKSESLNGKLSKFTAIGQQLDSALRDRNAATNSAQDFVLLSRNHVYWMNILAELRRILIQAETEQSAALTKANGGTNVDTGVWIELFDPELPMGSVFSGNAPEMMESESPIRSISQMDRFRGHPMMTNRPGVGRPINPAQPQANSSLSAVAGSSITSIRMICRLVDRTSILASANKEMAYAVKSIIEASTNYFTKAELGDKGLEADTNGDTNTFTFHLNVTLANPLKL